MQNFVICIIIVTGLIAVLLFYEPYDTTPPVLDMTPRPPVMCPMGMAMESMPLSHGPHNLDFKPLGQDPPQEEPPPTEGNPTHTEPTTYCTPTNRPDGKMPCTCLMQHPEGCKQGMRDTEHRSCNSWCWKDKCKCCVS